jgi:sarcosine oxidase
MARETHSDVIVIGMGAMGSATAYHLAKHGKRVLGLERFDIPHQMGSSHGVNRIIRLAYYEDPSYVPLLRRAYELWRTLQDEAREQLLYITGSIDASPPDGEVFTGSLRSCQLNDLPFEILTSAELTARFPGYRLPSEHLALLQPEGGFLLSERGIVAHVQGALAAGAEIHARERVLEWNTTSYGVRVQTDRDIYEAEQLVIATGSWIGLMVPALSNVAIPERQVLAWFQPLQPEYFAPERFPVFNLTVDEGRYYGFPVFGIPGFKVGRYHHLGGSVNPEMVDREPRPSDEALLRQFTTTYFPDADGPVMSMKACLFTNTPDEHFIVDFLPGASQVVVASPCSGHGYKFASVIGEIIAELLTLGESRHDTSLFAIDRFAVRA